MAVLVNNGSSPRDVWTPLGWKHVPVGQGLDAELEDSQLIELLDLGFEEEKPAKPEKEKAVAKAATEAKE